MLIRLVQLRIHGAINPIEFLELVIPTMRSFTSASISLSVDTCHLFFGPVPVKLHPISQLAEAFSTSSKSRALHAPALKELIMNENEYDSPYLTDSTLGAESGHARYLGIIQSLATLQDLEAFTYTSTYPKSQSSKTHDAVDAVAIQEKIVQRCDSLKYISFKFEDEDQ